MHGGDLGALSANGWRSERLWLAVAVVRSPQRISGGGGKLLNEVLDLCQKLDWKSSSAAPTYSQLAGVLAAFVFAGLIFVIESRRRSAGGARSLSLLIPSFIVLALCSFCYSLVSGDQLDESCVRREVVATVAAQLLALGAACIGYCILYLVVDYVEDGDGSELGPFGEAAHSLSRTAATGTALVVTFLLAATTGGTAQLVVRGDGSVKVWMIALSVAAVVCAILGRAVASRPSREAPSSMYFCCLRMASTGAVIYAIAATAFVGGISWVPESDLELAAPWLAWPVAALCAILPVAILAALVMAAPAPRVTTGES